MKRLTYSVLLFCLFCFLVAGCGKDKKESPDISGEVLVDVLPMIVDSLSKVYDLNNRYLVYFALSHDEVEKLGYDNLSEFFSERSDTANKEQLKMLDLLRQRADDSLRISGRDMTFGSTTLYFTFSDSLLATPNYYGTFSLSNIVFNSNESDGALYVAVNCRKDGSRGMVFFIKRRPEGWRIDHIYQVWGSRR